MPSVQEVEEGVGGRGLVVTLLDLAEAHVVDDEQLGCAPAFQALGVAAVSEAREEVVEQVHAARVADRDLLLTCLEPDGLKDVAFPRTALACEEKILGPAHPVQEGQLQDHRAIELGLEGEVERLQALALAQAAQADAALDAVLALDRRLLAQDLVEQGAGRRVLAQGPGEVLVQVLRGVGQSEPFEVSSQPLDEVTGVGGDGVWFLGHVSFSSGVIRDGMDGSWSYSARSRGAVSR